MSTSETARLCAINAERMEAGIPMLASGQEQAILHAEISALRRSGHSSICRCGRTIPAGWGLTLDNKEWMCPNCFLPQAAELLCERERQDTVAWILWLAVGALVVLLAVSGGLQ